LFDEPIRAFDKEPSVELTSDDIAPKKKLQDKIDASDKPIIKTLSSKFDENEEDDLDKPAYLRKGMKLESSIIETSETAGSN
jgi:hypothetical protein